MLLQGVAKSRLLGVLQYSSQLAPSWARACPLRSLLPWPLPWLDWLACFSSSAS